MIKLALKQIYILSSVSTLTHPIAARGVFGQISISFPCKISDLYLTQKILRNVATTVSLRSASTGYNSVAPWLTRVW